MITSCEFIKIWYYNQNKAKANYGTMCIIYEIYAVWDKNLQKKKKKLVAYHDCRSHNKP